MLIGKRQDLCQPRGVRECDSSFDSWRAARAGTEQLRAVADLLLEAVERSIKAGEGEAAANFLQLAARALEAQSRWLASSRMEQAIQALAATLPAASATRFQPAGVRRLHVLNRALPYGGHTAMAARWIRSGEPGEIHDVVLLSQPGPVPDILARAVADTGGQVSVLDPASPILVRAAELRGIVHAKAVTSVVLHVDTHDVIAALAFGVPGGPPVMTVNHAAHIFWAGGSCTDLVVNCRGSRLEAVWTSHHRGLKRYSIVPIPLVPPASPVAGAAERGRETMERARAELGLPAQACIILTVGDTYKYQPALGLDFTETCRRLLAARKDLVILGVGVVPNVRWDGVARATGGRLRALGRQTDVARFHRAADLYIEGFPFGSTTALLEAGLARMPVVLAPAQCRPPFGTDGVAVDDTLRRPANVAAYEREILRLVADPSAREELANAFHCSVLRHHTGAGWREHLRGAMAALPATHNVQRRLQPAETDADDYGYWHTFRSAGHSPPERWLDDYLRLCIEAGERTHIPRSLVEACGANRKSRRGAAIPVPLLRLLCNGVMPVLPTPLARKVFVTVYDHLRPNSRSMRLLEWLLPPRLW
jgi:hypothetical protein